MFVGNTPILEAIIERERECVCMYVCVYACVCVCLLCGGCMCGGDMSLSERKSVALRSL